VYWQAAHTHVRSRVTRWESRRSVQGISLRAAQRGQVSVFWPGCTSNGSHATFRGSGEGFAGGVMRASIPQRRRRGLSSHAMSADLVLVVTNVVYATSYAATRLTLDYVPPATLALIRLVIGALVLIPLAVALQPAAAAPIGRADRWNIRWMGVLGFAGAFAFSHWGIARSTATNAALLITVEPISLILLSPWALGERLTRRERLGATLALAGAAVVVVNGIPGITAALVPHWRGDLLLILAGLAYAAYSLFGRGVLTRHPAITVTAWSIAWGVAAMLPLAALEWSAGVELRLNGPAILGVLYLAVLITALGYLGWNWALERVPAPRAAIFLNIQPLVGALLGVYYLGEPLTAFTVAGGVLILIGLTLTVKTPGRG
jgi:drug/metabolite transporter (DMT)-like permease